MLYRLVLLLLRMNRASRIFADDLVGFEKQASRGWRSAIKQSSESSMRAARQESV